VLPAQLYIFGDEPVGRNYTIKPKQFRLVRMAVILIVA
jgi:hypothetical protein